MLDKEVHDFMAFYDSIHPGIWNLFKCAVIYKAHFEKQIFVYVYIKRKFEGAEDF